jgi:hypothetical protein
MPRKKKQQIKVNNSTSLEGLMQEVYNDACSQINDAQRTINELTNSTTAEDVADATSIAREKSNAQKIKDSGVKIKLEVAKLQADIIKHNGNLDDVNQSRTSSGAPSLDDFKQLRTWVKNGGNDEDNESKG